MTMERGTTVYWAKMPKGKFTFIGVNKDGSFHIVGGEAGYSSGRDAVPDEVSTAPFQGTDQIEHWAKREDTFAKETTVADMTERFGLPQSTVAKFVRENPQLFRKVGHGKYEVRGYANEQRRETERGGTGAATKRRAI